MKSHYSISVEPDCDLLLITLAGFFDNETIRAFDRDRRAAFALLTSEPNQHLAICNISRCNLQSQEAVAMFKKMLNDPSLFSRKLAFITGSSLAWMQARRILERDAVSCFETEAAARVWLFEAEGAPA